MSVESDRRQGGVVRGIRVDVRQLHDAWMELVFPRQRDAEHSVLGRWQPETTRDKVVYWLWAAVGILPVLVLYPLALLGFATRFYSRRFDSAATRLGVLGVFLLAVLVWGALTAVAYLRFSTEAVAAVGAASGVAVVSAALAALFSQKGGRASTVLLAYPFGVTAIFLPPVVAAVVAPSLDTLIQTESTQLADYLLTNLLGPVGLEQYFRSRFDLEGLNYVFMWLGISVPLGWLLGTLVTLANFVRPGGEPDGAAEADGSGD
jgi:MFS family permease